MSGLDVRAAAVEEVVLLRNRIDRLEAESRRAFGDAQREADALFAQYQLSQLLASGGSLGELATAVVVELVRLSGGEAGAIWLGEHGSAVLTRAASVGPETDARSPVELEGLDAARSWSASDPRCTGLVLDEEPPTFLALWASESEPLDTEGLRVAQLARHELGVAFAGARLREALERERHDLAAIVDGATDVILQVDEDRRVLRLNGAGERLLGQSVPEAIGRTCAEVLGCDVAGGHREADCPLAEVLSSGVPIVYRETALRGSHGDAVRVAGSYTRSVGRGADITTGGGRATATAILRDISAVRALEQLREGFVATVSHELRTPLALIRGYADTLLHLELDAATERSYVERIHQVTDRLAALVTQILDVTRLDADPLVLERAPASFAALVARLRGDLVLGGEDGRLVVDVPADLPPIEVDSGRIGQVLENVVANALKYAPEGPVVIGASVEGDWLVATVDDDGIGIPEAERRLVLEPFHRAGNVRESRIPGTGLGLYICRRLIEAHGGELRILDRPDGRAGTRIAFSLPLLPNRGRAVGREAERRPSRPPAGSADG
ncbi:MAG TPA: ATP-binding protein [Candidatus Limnocylindria bacterium]|nr:ATP-binding protein [Candidatus Limnocylindria bacterium]